MVSDADREEGREERAAGSAVAETVQSAIRESSRSIKRRAVPGQRGFTLVELMVAISVLLIGALAAFATQITSGQMIDFSRDVTVAVSDLEMCMEELLVHSADEMPIAYPEGTPVAAFNALHLRNEDIVPSYLNWDVGQPIPDPLEVLLTATWADDAGRIQTQTLLTAKSR